MRTLDAAAPPTPPDAGVRVVLLDLGEDVPRQRDALRRAARRLVGDALGVPSDKLPLRRGRNGKPELDGAPLHFAAAAQGACGAVALCWTDRIGLELAPVRAEPPLDGLSMVLPDRVQRAVKAAAPDARPREFALWWARLRAAVTACAGRLDEAEECMAATPQRARLVGPDLAAGVAGNAVATGPVRWERDR